MNRIIWILLFAFQSMFAQDYPEEYYKSNLPTEEVFRLNENDTGNVNRLLYKQIILEYRYDEEKNLYEYTTERWKVKLESDQAIEDYNKIYINLNTAISLEHAVATITKPNGEVREIGKDQMIEEKNFEEYGRFYFFALDGLEIGSIVELDYTSKYYPEIYGSRVIAQEDVPVYNFSFDLIAPSDLIFSFMPIGTEQEVSIDTSDELRSHWTLALDYLSPYKEEPYSNILPNIVSCYYKLDENKEYANQKITSYNWAAQTVYESIHKGSGKNTTKKIKKLSKELGLYKLKTDEEKIRAVELYIKTTITYADDPEIQGLNDLNTILDKKMSNDFGMTILMANWMKVLEINYQIVLTCDRFDQIFDQNFESYSYLNQYLIYFPESGEFVSPSNPLTRYGLPPYELTNNYGLFIMPLKIGSTVTAIPSVKWISSPTSDQSVDSTVYEVMLDDMDNPKIKTYKSLTGYEAAPIHAFMVHYSQEQLQELQEAIIKNIRDDEEIISVNSENIEEEHVGMKDLIFKGEISYPNLVGVAGDNYLINVGSIIGLQVELYQESERVNDIYMEFNHAYDRTIIVNIPEGFEVKKVESLDLDFRYSIEEEEKMAFVSSYEIIDNQLIIRNYEYYNTLFMDKEHFEGFREVINAAADFNKAVVILSKI